MSETNYLMVSQSRLLYLEEGIDEKDRRIKELEAEIERLRAVAEWFVGIGLDYIPNEVYHERGGYSLVVKSGVLGESD